jgi:hypothetical protein
VKIRMKEQILGTRDGVRWPAPGGEVTLPDYEGAKLCAAGSAEPVAEPTKTEKRPAAKRTEKRA